MPHVNQLIDKFGAKGFAAVGITSESQNETRKFTSETGAKWVVAYDAKSGEKYGVDGFPSAFLIDPSGTVVWKGHPASLEEAQIERLLKKVRATLELPSKFSSIASLYDKGKPGEAFSKLEEELKKLGLPEAEKNALEAGRKLILDQSQGDIEEAKSLEKKGDAYSALEIYDRASRAYAGMEAAQEGAAAVARIRADVSLKTELEAGAKVADAVKKTESQSYQIAWKILTNVEKSFPGSFAAGKAGELKTRIREQGYYGFNSNCKDCNKIGKACTECRLGAKW